MENQIMKFTALRENGQTTSNGSESDQPIDAEVIDMQDIVKINESEFAVKYYIFALLPNGQIVCTGNLYLPAILESLKDLGFYKRRRHDGPFMFLQEKDNIISAKDPSEMKDAFFGKHLRYLATHLIFYLGTRPHLMTVEEQQQVYLKNASRVFNQKFLEHLETHTKPIMADTRHNSYFFFKNVVVTAGEDGLACSTYADLQEKCVWEDHIIQRDFNLVEEFDQCHYAQFIENVAGERQGKIDAFKSGIGYLLNNYNSPSRSQAVVCYDEEPSLVGEPNGGTGKGVFCKAIKQLRDTFKLDGKNIRRDDKFKFQGITERTQLFWIDDAADNFPFEMLHSAITDGFTVEKKYQHQFYIPAEKSPKVVLCSNTILSSMGKTNIRRQFILEFSDFYSQRIVTGAEEPIKDIHGGIFFDDDSWGQAEWDKFFSFMINCAVYFHQNGLKPYTQVGRERSRLVQTTNEAFAGWVENVLGEPEGEYDTKELFDQYKLQTGEVDPTVTARRFNGWITVYAEFKGWELRSRESNGRKKISFLRP